VSRKSGGCSLPRASWTSCTSPSRRSSWASQPGAPRFVAGGVFPWNTDRRMSLAEVRQMGDVVLLRYLLPAVDAG